MVVETANETRSEAEHRSLLYRSLSSKSPRVERLLAVIHDRMERPQESWGAEETVLTDPEVAQRSLVRRHAAAFSKTLREMPIAIEADDFIVGNTVRDGVIVRTKLARYATEEEQERANEQGAKIVDHLSHKTPFYYKVMSEGLAGVLEEIDEKIEAIRSRPPSEPVSRVGDRGRPVAPSPLAGEDSGEGGPAGGRNTCPTDGGGPLETTSPGEAAEKLDLFLAMREECVAVIGLAHRHAALAEKQAGVTADEERRQELLKIASVCRRVPEHPPSSFHEAVQCFWFIHYAMFSTGTNISCGRLDQFLHPALERDLAAGAIDLEAAQELVDCLWMRFNDRMQIRRENFFSEDRKDEVREWPAGHRTRFAFALDAADAINHFGQNILLSGIRPDGSDGTNPLTYLCLNALEKFAFTSPVVTIRLHKGSPPELVDRAMEVLRVGSGMPYINNDDVLVRAYNDLGVPIEDARDYANSNCWETMIEGKSDQELIRGFNFLLFLELALNRGVSKAHGRMGPDTGDPKGFASFEEFMEAWKAQIDGQLQQGIDYIGHGVETGTLEHSKHGRYSYNPFLSALTLDCIANEEDITRGGARYTIWHVMGEAVANAINSMAAIKRLVFEERTLGLDELRTALEADWDGHELLRQRARSRAPKFANDDESVDAMGREMMDWFVDRAHFHAARHPGVIFPPSVGTFSWYRMIGKEVGPTPEGRHDGEAVAANFSPESGTDLSGPTSAINSYVKMRVGDMAAGAPLDLRMSSSSVKGPEGITRMAGLTKAFIALGGNMLTLTVTDVEELKRAMAEPEKYRHLRVRMGGWSAYFVMLSEEQQRLHIQRVEHGLV